jgi:hypothetical protein
VVNSPTTPVSFETNRFDPATVMLIGSPLIIVMNAGFSRSPVVLL